MNFGGDVVGEEAGSGGITPAPVEREAEEKNIEPINQQGRPIVDELGEQRSGERSEGDGAEE